MQVCPCSLGHRLVGSVAYQDVAKAEGVITGERRWLRLYQLLSEECLKTRANARSRRLRRQVCDGAPVEHPANHRRSLEHGSLLLLKAIQASRDQGEDRLRRRHARELGGGHPLP